MERDNTFHWMHISDLHRGQSRTAQMWGLVRDEIHKDVQKHVETNGPIDLVIFSGDLAFKGAADEFSSVEDELLELWTLFSGTGSNPRLFIVPGNHDLSRPSEDSPLYNLANEFRKKQGARKSLLENLESSYRGEIASIFENYAKFIERLSASKIPLVMDKYGLFTGDVSGKFKVNSLSIGLVGLNTAWSHLADGELEGLLDVYPDQLNSVVDNSLPKWASGNNISLLVTHHPASWFCEEARADFHSNIFVSDYFDAHLFGHMHDNSPSQLNLGGLPARKTFQAPSLFGLEKIKGEIDRRHGYTFAKISAESGMCRVWPRRLQKKALGNWQSVADSEVLDRDQLYFDWPWPIRNFQPKK